MLQIKILFLASVLLTTVSFCKRSPGQQKITLHVSETHVKLFAGLTKHIYNATEAEATLNKISEQGDRYCSGMQTGNFASAGFFNAGAAETTVKGREKDLYVSALSGCHNWYSMSDVAVEDDFIKINAVSNKLRRAAFDCYSVGFLQPYIMAANLNCTRLNIVDADYRIIKAHLDFLNLAKANPLSDPKALLSSLKLGFPAGLANKNFQDKTPLSLAELCGKNTEIKCLHFLIQFLEKQGRISEINLMLTPLHEFSFLPDQSRSEAVFYTSNAFDPHFTSENEFAQFMRGFDTNTEDSQRMVIYHQAEEKSFGIYKIGKAGQISTVCADRYLNVVAGRFSTDRCRYFPGKFTAYETYFDKKSVNHRLKNLCAEK